ncbi:MAG: pilus assembly protein PilB, partial [Thermoanaerobaculia bacterium]
MSDSESISVSPLEQSRGAPDLSGQEAEELATRLGLELVDMEKFRIDNDLFRSISFDLMLRYCFLPESEANGRLAIVMSDPTDITKLDELELLLGKVLEVKIGDRGALEEILQKSESAQRILDDATEDFKLQLIQDSGEGEDVLSIDRISADRSPIIKLVDSTIFNAIQRRASDIHIETRDSEVIIK